MPRGRCGATAIAQEELLVCATDDPYTSPSAAAASTGDGIIHVVDSNGACFSAHTGHAQRHCVS
jgi:hypothetical protein